MVKIMLRVSQYLLVIGLACEHTEVDQYSNLTGSEILPTKEQMLGRINVAPEFTMILDIQEQLAD